MIQRARKVQADDAILPGGQGEATAARTRSQTPRQPARQAPQNVLRFRRGLEMSHVSRIGHRAEDSYRARLHRTDRRGPAVVRQDAQRIGAQRNKEDQPDEGDERDEDATISEKKKCQAETKRLLPDHDPKVRYRSPHSVLRQRSRMAGKELSRCKKRASRESRCRFSIEQGSSGPRSSKRSSPRES